jgi:hypothetical protein
MDKFCLGIKNMEYQYTWETCPEHEWFNPDDNILDAMFSKFSDVRCTKCGMPGQLDHKTGEVFFPAT